MANPHIISFIRGLSAAERRLVEEHLSKSQALFEESNHELMELKLFKFILVHESDIITDEEIINETSSKRVTDLKNNLFQKVLEALTLDKYITNSTLFNEHDRIFFQLKKKLLLCRITLRTANQKKTEALNVLLDEIIDKAKSFEIYEVLIEALRIRKYFGGIRQGSDDFEKIAKELEFYEYSNKAVFDSADNYYLLILNNDFVKSLSAKEVNKHIADSIKRMENDFKKTKSEQVNYYLHIMKFALCETRKDYKGAIKYCEQLISILKKEKAVFREERMGYAYTNLCQYHTYLGKTSEALKEAKKAQQYYLEDSFNNAIAKELEFYTNFYCELFTDSNKCLNSLLSHSRIDTGEFRRSKYIYYRACVFFAEGNYKEALSLLNESLEIEKDKTRWNISLRILNIMIFIEMDKINEAFTSLESLRKYMERTSKTEEVSPRDILIVKLLRELEKSGFEWETENKTTAGMLKQLSEKDSETSWEYFSSELIPFHEWVNKKIK
jgi:tetratricopeptide (TPR) repeat protein